ncbi:MAG: hypothetical protein O4806_07790 [Trichodesmium sp. St5_bin8]|nr:hypothetical protein [Trichodesmium sp. St4_bin8_1]MDE5071753.1 hypothetical protein [Trichodesmium sp. St5_bin8]
MLREALQETSCCPDNDNLFEKLKHHIPNFSLRISNLTAAVLRPEIEFLENKISQDRQTKVRQISQNY